MVAIVMAAAVLVVLVTVLCWACIRNAADTLAGETEMTPPWSEPEPEKVYGMKELEVICGVSRKTLKRYIDAGRLKAEKVEGKWEIKEGDLQAFLDWREGK